MANKLEKEFGLLLKQYYILFPKTFYLSFKSSEVILLLVPEDHVKGILTERHSVPLLPPPKEMQRKGHHCFRSDSSGGHCITEFQIKIWKGFPYKPSNNLLELERRSF